MYKAELELEKRLNDIALANVPSTVYENIVIVPKFQHHTPLQMSPEDFDLRDLMLDQKMNVISMNSIVDRLGWKPSKIKSDVTKEMIADYQLEQMKNIKQGVYIPASLDLDLLAEPAEPNIPDEAAALQADAIIKGLLQEMDVIQQRLADLPELKAQALDQIEQQLNTELTAIDASPLNPVRRGRARIAARRLYQERFDRIQRGEQREIFRLNRDYNDRLGESARIGQLLADRAGTIREYQREVQEVQQENARRRKIYQDEIKTVNRGINYVSMSPDETADEYKQRLKDIGDSTANQDAIQAAAALLYTDRLREKMSEITRDDALVNTFILNLNSDQRYSLVKMWETFKKKVLEIFGTNNPYISVDDLSNIAEEFADIVAGQAVSEAPELKDPDPRAGQPIQAYAIQQGGLPPLTAQVAVPFVYPDFELSEAAKTLYPPRKEAILKFVNQRGKLPDFPKLKTPEKQKIYEEELARAREHVRKKENDRAASLGTALPPSVPTLRKAPSASSGIPPLDELKAEIADIISTLADQDARDRFLPFLDYSDVQKLIRDWNDAGFHFNFEATQLTGSGLHTKYPKLMPFGLIELSPHKLFYENILKITRKGKRLTGFPNVKVSNEFVNFLFKILDGHQPTLRDVNHLSAGEKQLFDSIVFTSGLQKKVEPTGSGVKQSFKDRLALIEGEIEAGNTSEELIKEARKILQHLARMKIIGHRAAAAHLKQLINVQRG